MHALLAYLAWIFRFTEYCEEADACTEAHPVRATIEVAVAAAGVVALIVIAGLLSRGFWVRSFPGFLVVSCFALPLVYVSARGQPVATIVASPIVVALALAATWLTRRTGGIRVPHLVAITTTSVASWLTLILTATAD
jgi:hypothetical protein